MNNFFQKGTMTRLGLVTSLFPVPEREYENKDQEKIRKKRKNPMKERI